MNQSQVSLILLLVIVAEVLFLIFYDRVYFGLYIDIAVVILLFVAAYLGYRYLEISNKMPVRVTEIKNME